MALAETAELAVRLTLDDKLSPALGKMQGKLGGIQSAFGKVGRAAGIALGGAAVLGVTALTAALKAGVDALRADKIEAAQTAAVLKSTGGAAGITAQQVADLAEKLSLLNGVQDDVVQHAENILLTFTKISGDAFPAVTQAALDMSAALGRDVQSSALALGKALNDPIKGMTALQKIGVRLTDQQVAEIKHLVATNQLRKAQALILGEVQKRYKGVAQAQADADPGRRLQIGIERLQKALASGLLPVIEKVQVRLTEWLLKPSTIATFKALGDSIASIFTDQNLDAAASAIETAASAVSAALSAFNALPPEIKALAIGAFAINKVTGGAVGGIASAFGKILGAGLQKIFAANVTVIGTNVTGGIPGAGGGGGGTGLLGVGLLTAAFVAAFNEVGLARNGVESGNIVPGVTPNTTGQFGRRSANVKVTNAQDIGKALTGNLGRNGPAVDFAPKLIAAERTTIARLQTRLAAAIRAGNTTAANRIRAKIDQEKEKLAALLAKRNTVAAQQKATEQASLAVFRANERASLTGNSLQRSANAKLDALRHKKTNFKTVVNVKTAVSVRSTNSASRVYSRVARATQLVAS